MKTIKLKDLGIQDHIYDDSGIFHAIVEALTVALKEKSWDNIFAVEIDAQTNEGVVIYEDTVFSDEPEYSDAKLEAVHLFTFLSSQLFARYYLKRFSSFQSYENYFSKIFSNIGEHKVENSEVDSVLNFNLALDKYLPFIYSCSKKLACAKGKSLLGSVLQKAFYKMGFSFND